MALVLLVAAGAAGSNNNIPGTPAAALLWPLPKSITLGHNPPAVLAAANASFFGAAPSALLSRAFERYAKLLPTCAGAVSNTSDVVSSFELRVDDPEAPGPAEFMDEAYSLLVPSRGAVQAHAATQWGALRALESFSQIAATCTLQGTPIRVDDAPRFTHRGIMLDLARRFWPANALLSVLDAMAISKLNVLHLHITDAESFMFESLAFPELNREGAYRQPSCAQPATHQLPPYGDLGGEPCIYRQAMLRQLVAEATDRGIRVVPEFDMPAHAGSFGGAFPEIVVNCTTCTAGGLSHILLDPFQNTTWQVVGSILAEAAAIFPDARLHLGGDEVCWRCYNESASVRAAILGSGRQLDDDGFKWVVRTFLAQAQALAASHGRSTSVWNEAFGIYGPGNYGYAISNGDLPHRLYSINTELVRGTVVQDWWGGRGSWFGKDGRQDATNATAAVAHGMQYMNSEGWYLPISPPLPGNCSNWAKGGNCFNWTSVYLRDPATNKTCSYPAVGPPNCLCFEHGNAGAGTGCYDIAPDKAGGGGEYTQVLGGEACLWGNSPAPPYNVSAASRHLWPGGLAVAERLWSRQNVADWRSAAPRLEAQMGRVEQRVLLSVFRLKP